MEESNYPNKMYVESSEEARLYAGRYINNIVFIMKYSDDIATVKTLDDTYFDIPTSLLKDKF